MTGGRESAKELRKQRLESAALRLFRDRGFDAVTVEEVCAEAGVGPATFYRYFGSKDEVVFTYRGAFADALARAVDAARADPPVRQLGRVLTGFATALEATRDELGSRDAIVSGHPGLMRRTLAVQRETEDLLAEGLARLREDGDPDRARAEAALGVVVLRMGMRTWLAGGTATFCEGVRQALASAREITASLEV